MGEMLNIEVVNKTEIGERILELYNNGSLNQDEVGQLVPDEIVVQLVERKLTNINEAKGFIFKGFPRTLVQSYILDGLLKKHTASITKVIDIEVPTLELIKRLISRSKTDGNMPYDSSYEKIIKRLQEHETRTVPVIDKYSKLHGATKINGMGTFEVVNKRIAFEIENGFKDMK